MRKKRIGAKRRSVYPYECTGGCGKNRIAFDHERAKQGICVGCEKRKEDPNQAKLFDALKHFDYTLPVTS